MGEGHGGNWEYWSVLSFQTSKKGHVYLFSVSRCVSWANDPDCPLAYAKLKTQKTCLAERTMFCFSLRKLHEFYSNMNDNQQWLKSHWVASDMLGTYAHLREIMGWVSDHRSKTDIATKGAEGLFGFPVHTKVMLTSSCSLLSVQ